MLFETLKKSYLYHNEDDAWK